MCVVSLNNEMHASPVQRLQTVWTAVGSKFCRLGTKGSVAPGVLRARCMLRSAVGGGGGVGREDGYRCGSTERRWGAVIRGGGMCAHADIAVCAGQPERV